MAYPTKNWRKIIVGDKRYRWRAKGNDGWIDLTITAATCSTGQLLTAMFDYHSHYYNYQYAVDGTLLSRSGHQQLVVTSYHVRQVIEYGLLNGWQPDRSGLPMISLGRMDDKLDLRLPADNDAAMMTASGKSPE